MKTILKLLIIFSLFTCHFSLAPSALAGGASSPPTSPGGTNGDYQYNNNGQFGGKTPNTAGGPIVPSENSVTVTTNAATCNWLLGTTCVLALQNASTAWTLTMSNPVAGMRYMIRFVQNATGGASAAPLPTFSPTIRFWQGNQTPTLSTGIGEVDYATCYYSGVTPTGYDCAITQHYGSN